VPEGRYELFFNNMLNRNKLLNGMLITWDDSFDEYVGSGNPAYLNYKITERKKMIALKGCFGVEYWLNLQS